LYCEQSAYREKNGKGIKRNPKQVFFFFFLKKKKTVKKLHNSNISFNFLPFLSNLQESATNPITLKKESKPKRKKNRVVAMHTNLSDLCRGNPYEHNGANQPQPCMISPTHLAKHHQNPKA
jgi:hypothetical protein